ncbi:MAG: glycosyltransferase family 9 protein [Phycisphaerales bacterium]
MTDPAPPLRLLIVLPSWVGDAVMATPALRLIRDAYRGAFIGALCRPGINDLLAGSGLVDEFHVERVSGVMGPKFVAAKVRPRRYDTCLLLTNSFSTALTVRIAGIPRRVGYDRDARGLLLSHPLAVPKKGPFAKALIPAVTYYWRAAESLIHSLPPGGGGRAGASAPTSQAPDTATATLELPVDAPMELATTPAEEAAANEVLAKAIPGSAPAPLALLNPGGNNEAKRWPADRFAALADHLVRTRGFTILINGSPAEGPLCRAIAQQTRALNPAAQCGVLPDAGITLGALKAIVKRSALMVTNDTGPRHIAAAFGVPMVSLFGPTDHRWTLIPTRPSGPEEVVVADPTLPADQLSNDHPDRCRIDRIEVARVIEACGRVLGQRV